MRILYIHSHAGGIGDGVHSKIAAQVGFWQAEGHEVKLVHVSHGQVEGKLKKFLTFFTLSHEDKEIASEVQSFQPDVIYLRASKYRYLYRKLTDSFPVVVEVNTLDVAELRSEFKAGRISRLAYLHTMAGRCKLHAHARGYVFVTREILEHQAFSAVTGLKCVVPNSLNEQSITIKQAKPKDRLQFFFIGNKGSVGWHGVDEIIAFGRKVQEIADVCLVGLDPLEGETPPNVKFLEVMERSEFAHLLEETDVAISTAALYRKGMLEACPLKTRTYAEFGVPMVLPYTETALNELAGECPWWCLELPCEPHSLVKHAEEIVEFAKRVRGRRMSEAEVIEVFGATNWETKRVQFLKEIVDS